MHKRLITMATIALAVVALAATSAFGGGGGRLQLYLVNSGPTSGFYNDSLTTDGGCGRLALASSLSTSPGTSLRTDSVGYLPDVQVSSLSYTVPAGGGFTIPASADAIVLKLWAYSGDGTCDGQNVNPQTIGWSVDCNGPTCGSVHLVSGPDSGYADIAIAANTPKNTLQNIHVGVSSPVNVGAGDTITLKFQSNTYAPIQWNAPNGAGASSLNILTG